MTELSCSVTSHIDDKAMSRNNVRIRKATITVVLSLLIGLSGLLLPDQSSSALAMTALPEIHEAGLPPLTAWLPPGKPKAAVLCVHGLGLHMGSFEDFGERLKTDGIAIYSMDIRGFGSWYMKGNSTIDFPATLTDLEKAADYIAKKNPGVPIFILGESMGGAVALRAAATYPNKFTGLICSVPSGDRFGDLNADLHIPFRVITGGFKQRFDVGTSVIKYATKDEEHRKKWADDARCRKDYSAGELLGFQNFMNKNFDAAKTLQSMPVLFVQGMNDKLVRPSGTWGVYDHLLTPNRKIVFSKTGEHLIFENGRFDDEDLGYMLGWMTENAHGVPQQVAVPPTPPADNNEQLASASTSGLSSAIDAANSAPSVIKKASNITYWIELKRNGKTFRCNNKTQFQSGDEIRFHVRCGVNGFAYILMQQGTAGGKAVLFPENRTGTNNEIGAGSDCAIPTKTYLRFDEHPGIERVSVIFSKKQIDINNVLRDPNTITAFVSPDKSGSKDLVPTRMQLSWDDPNPVLMPTYEPSSQLASTSSSVQLAYGDTDTIALDIALEHR